MSDQHADDVIITPNCPGCEQRPRLRFYQQYFCANDDCAVFCWNPTQTPEEFMKQAHVLRIDW